jgi:GTPase SAR1 family protein
MPNAIYNFKLFILIGEEINFMLWDTAGQEEYDQLTKEYYKGISISFIND